MHKEFRSGPEAGTAKRANAFSPAADPAEVQVTRPLTFWSPFVQESVGDAVPRKKAADESSKRKSD